MSILPRWRQLLGLGLTFVAILLVSRPIGIARANETWQSALASILADDLQMHVDALADDMFEGREAGSRGGRAAGMYLVGFFEKYGLRPAGEDGSFFQPFQAGCRNILGVLEGSDPELKHQFVLIGAHYDHVGYGNRRNSFGPTGYIHNGADDNASGSAAVLELIEAFAGMLPHSPRRSIIFALWDGEEQGLLGSTHWVDNPTLPISQISTVINCDMIGRLAEKGLSVYGTRSFQGARRLVSRNNRHIGLPIDFNWELKANSDHWPFFQQDIPVLMFHTGLHDDYHRPSDDAHLVNETGMQQVTRLLFNVVHDLTQQSEPPRFREPARHETVADRERLEQALPSYPPRLGVWWDLSDVETAGVGIKRVVTGSAAERAGLRAGDRVVRFDGRSVSDCEQLARDILWARVSVEIVVERAGEDAPLDLQVGLSGKPVRVGISWREDDAEPGTAIVTRVVAGSPAKQVGMKVRDRVYNVGGQRFANSDDLSGMLKRLPGPLELLVERDGCFRTVIVDVPSPRS